MVCVFEYSDYRKYLLDYYTLQKSERPSFSYQVLAQKAGFKDKGFIHSVIHGTKNLSKPSIIKLSLALCHSIKETDFFENMVFFNQAKSLKEKNYYFERMNAVSCVGKEARKIRQLRKDQYEVCTVWHHGVIRSLIDMAPFRGDFENLAKQVYPPITQRQAKQSVELLERLGLVRRDKDGVYRVSDRHLTTGPEIQSLAGLNYHKSMTQLADQALSFLPAAARNMTGLTIGISPAAYERITREISGFRARIVEIVNADACSDRVYQLNFHLFPLSKPLTRKKD
jgi:uncharacterized protein (TIGR02147 family)